MGGRLKSETTPESMNAPAKPLSKEDIAAAALEEINGLSSSKVARRLGVGQSTLYRHVSDRSDLIKLGYGHGLSQMKLPEASLSWREYVTTGAKRYWAFLQSHPGFSKEIKTTRPMTPETTKMGHKIIRDLTNYGFDVSTAALLSDMVDQLVLDVALRCDLLNSRGSSGRSVFNDQLAYYETIKDKEIAEAAIAELKVPCEEKLMLRLNAVLDGFALRLPR